MKNNKIIININNLNEVEEYKKIGITNFLFAVDEFSIGYNSFSLEEIKKISGNIYLLINRIMDNKSIDSFKEEIKNLSFVKGVFFEDIGVYNVLKDLNISLIFNQTQFATNSMSINYWLKRTDSVVLSNSLCEEEIIDIVDAVDKPIVFNIFGKNMVMYSRRTLLSNYNAYMNIESNNNAIIKEKISIQEFKIVEDKNGTVFFNNKYFNYYSIISKIDDRKIKFYYINNLDLGINDIKKILNNEFVDYDLGFLNKKTIFKVGDIRD